MSKPLNFLNEVQNEDEKTSVVLHVYDLKQRLSNETLLEYKMLDQVDEGNGKD